MGFPAHTTDGRTVTIVEKIDGDGADPRQTAVLVDEDGWAYQTTGNGHLLEEIELMGDVPEPTPVGKAELEAALQVAEAELAVVKAERDAANELLATALAEAQTQPVEDPETLASVEPPPGQYFTESSTEATAEPPTEDAPEEAEEVIAEVEKDPAE